MTVDTKWACVEVVAAKAATWLDVTLMALSLFGLVSGVAVVLMVVLRGTRRATRRTRVDRRSGTDGLTM